MIRFEKVLQLVQEKLGDCIKEIRTEQSASKGTTEAIINIPSLKFLTFGVAVRVVYGTHNKLTAVALEDGEANCFNAVTLIGGTEEELSKSIIDYINKFSTYGRYNKMCNYLRDCAVYCYGTGVKLETNIAREIMYTIDENASITGNSFNEIMQYVKETATRLYECHSAKYDELAECANIKYTEDWNSELEGLDIALADVVTGFSGQCFVSNFDKYEVNYKVTKATRYLVDNIKKTI